LRFGGLRVLQKTQLSRREFSPLISQSSDGRHRSKHSVSLASWDAFLCRGRQCDIEPGYLTNESPQTTDGPNALLASLAEILPNWRNSSNPHARNSRYQRSLEQCGLSCAQVRHRRTAQTADFGLRANDSLEISLVKDDA
jgi:hypothetical protein